MALLLVTFAIVGGGWLKFTFMPPVEADTVTATMEMPLGTPFETTSEAVGRLLRELQGMRITLRVAKGEVEAGLAELRALAERKPEEPAGWIILGTEARIEGRFAEAEAALERALVAGGWQPALSTRCGDRPYLAGRGAGLGKHRDDRGGAGAGRWTTAGSNRAQAIPGTLH